ncbi:MAG: hypothetical protein U5K27_02230 [Desulfotignum sp.]|nr:hypothetical protein [Desulfotignum sp.]
MSPRFPCRSSGDDQFFVVHHDFRRFRPGPLGHRPVLKRPGSLENHSQYTPGSSSTALPAATVAPSSPGAQKPLRTPSSHTAGSGFIRHRAGVISLVRQGLAISKSKHVQVAGTDILFSLVMMLKRIAHFLSLLGVCRRRARASTGGCGARHVFLTRAGLFNHFPGDGIRVFSPAVSTVG